MGANRVIIGLFPDRAEAAVLRRGDLRDSAAFRPEVPRGGQTWAEMLRDVTRQLTTWVAEHDLHGAGAHILFRSPTEATDFVSLETTSASDACEAAIISCGELIPYSLESACIETVVVGRTRTPSPRTHVVVAAERDDHAHAMCACIEASGLRFDGATPIDAAVLAQCASHAIRLRPGNRAILYMGEEWSVFIIREKGGLGLVRRIHIGYGNLVTALTRPIQGRANQPPVELTPDEALRIVFRNGLVDPNDVVDQARDLRGIAILPVIQPLLQRFVVELRQSVRFGVDETERDGLTLELLGPGASIPNLATLLESELGVRIARSGPICDPDAPIGPGSDMHTAVQSPRVLNSLKLLPATVAAGRRAGRLKRALWTGAAVALAAVAFDSVQQHRMLQHANAEADSVHSLAEQQRALQETNMLLVEAMSSIRRVDDVIDESFHNTEYGALLKELSLLAPRDIRLTSLEFSTDRAGRVIGVISGYSFGSPDSSGILGDASDLDVFVDRVSTSEFFADVHLREIRQGEVHGKTGERFELSFSVVSMPFGQMPIVNRGEEEPS